MSKVQSLFLSSFASGFALCSVVFAIFTMTSGLSFMSFFRFVLALLFLGINLLFAVHYYTAMSKELNFRNRNKARIQK